MICPKCGVVLVEGESDKQEDGTEYTEFACPECGQKFTDLTIPYSALLDGGDDYLT